MVRDAARDASLAESREYEPCVALLLRVVGGMSTRCENVACGGWIGREDASGTLNALAWMGTFGATRGLCLDGALGIAGITPFCNTSLPNPASLPGCFVLPRRNFSENGKGRFVSAPARPSG